MAIYQAINGKWYDGATSKEVPAPAGASTQVPVSQPQTSSAALPTGYSRNSDGTYTVNDGQGNSYVTTTLPAAAPAAIGSNGDYSIGQTVTSKYGGGSTWDATYTYAGNGQWTYSDPFGHTGSTPATTQQLLDAGALSSAGNSQTPASTSTATNGATTHSNDASVTDLLANSSLSDDQKKIIQTIYNTVSVNDTQNATKIASAITAGMQFSDPYFKAQANIALDALTRGLSSKDGDLSFAEGQLQKSLKALQDNTAASKDELSFEHAQELKNLAQKYESDLSTTQDNLAAAGLTSSSKRARAEQILSDTNSGLVESSNKTFGYQTGNLDRALSTQDASTQAQIANLQRLTAEGKLDLFRSTEGAVGSSALPTVNGLTPLGGVAGDIPQAQAKDALSFAQSYVF